LTADVQPRQFTVSQGGQRLDQFLASQGLELTRSQVQRLIEEGQVRLNGQPARPAQRVKPGDGISLTIPPPRRLDLLPQAMPLAVVYQDPELLVVDKPAGLAVHPGPGHPDRTLVNALLALCPDLPGVGGALRPGIVHRLDKDTSGLMVVAKTDRAHHALSAQIKDRRAVKGYLALATGDVPQAQGVVDEPIARDPRHRQRMAVVAGGREARTRYRVLERLLGEREGRLGPPAHPEPVEGRARARPLMVRQAHHERDLSYSLLEVYLETGRTHQIRVHLAYLGHPLLGDAVYGKASPLLGRQFLHACHLAFQHPATGQPLDFRAPLPAELRAVLQGLGGQHCR
jgi:23S rRNA pseudouridine1911/1915/1917 synthase